MSFLHQAKDDTTGDVYRWVSAGLDWTGASYPGPNSPVPSSISVYGSPAASGSSTWASTLAGSPLSGANNPTLSDGAYITNAIGQTLKIQSEDGDPLLLTSKDASVDNAGNVDIYPGLSLGVAGATATIRGGNSSTDGGDLVCTSGAGSTSSGDTRIGTGSASGQSGSVIITTAIAGLAGGVQITPATSSTGNGPNVNIEAGDSVAGGTTAGSLLLAAGSGPTGGNVDLTPGNGATKGKLRIIIPGGPTYLWPETDGSAGDVLKTDGAGNLYWEAP